MQINNLPEKKAIYEEFIECGKASEAMIINCQKENDDFDDDNIALSSCMSYDGNESFVWL